MEVHGAAEDIWAVYISPNFPKLIDELLPDVFERIDYVKGTGGVGTIIQVVYSPGIVPRMLKEQFATIEDHRRLKEVQQNEGGHIAMGVKFHMISFKIIKKGSDSCIIRSKIEYIVPDDLVAKISPLINVESLVGMARAITKYVLDNKRS
ncbi:S-norcoclaurine synthase 2-like [Papaver somniferum]|uniref:S-norcoclaurine synthase 2-like n=1 Tax=Papaver somniferum TaxID=3469 RepID=UPI000E6FEB0D|nr:S-norcoclaurine synthase 2-like [Papaver somniferum]